MIWNGQEIETYGQLSNAIIEIAVAQDQQAAREFMAKYTESNPEHAAANVGYLTGYYTPEMRRRVQQMFEVQHPIFKFCK